MNLESTKVSVAKSAKEVFEFLINLQNFEQLMPENTQKFEVDGDSLPTEFEVWFTNLNDQTCEGIKHKSKPISAVQFHPEACSGPEDAQYLFDRFIDQL